MKVVSIILGILLAICGFFLMLTPGMTFASMSWVVGFLLLLAGVSAVANYFASRKEGTQSVSEIVIGILCVLLGLFVLVNPLMGLLADGLLIYVFDFWLIIGGVLRIAGAVKQKKAGEKNWVWVMLVGILSVLVGAYALFHIVASAMAIGMLVGAVVLMNGISMVAASASGAGPEGGNGAAVA